MGHWFLTMWWGWYKAGGGVAMGREVRTLQREVRTLQREVHTLEREVRTLEKEVHTLEREVRTLEREVHTLEREVHTKCRGYQDTCRFRFRENGILEFTYITDFVTLHSKLEISNSLVSYPPSRRGRRRMGGVVVGVGLEIEGGMREGERGEVGGGKMESQVEIT